MRKILYSFPISALTNFYKFRGLKEHTCLKSSGWWVEGKGRSPKWVLWSQDQGVCRALLSGALGWDLLAGLAQPLVITLFLGLWSLSQPSKLAVPHLQISDSDSLHLSLHLHLRLLHSCLPLTGTQVITAGPPM